MRVLLLLLLLANAGFFAWSRLSPPETTADPAPLARQIEPEKLKIVAPSALPSPASPAPPKPAAAPPAPAAAVPPPPTVTLKCIEWGAFTLADAAQAEKALAPLALGPRLAQRRTAEETAGWWVFIPSQTNRQGALRKAAELKELGVIDYFIMQEEGPLRWSLSLGVFRTEEAAQARLAALREQGVRTAQVGQRETVVPKVWLQVSGVDPALERQLAKVALQMDGSELRNCP